jgi:hypothetical protein
MKKMRDATPEQERAMISAWLQRKGDMKEEKHRPLEKEDEHITYPESGTAKYLNKMRELNVANTEGEEEKEGGEAYDGKKREGEGKEKEGKKEGEERKEKEEAEGAAKDDGKDQEGDEREKKEAGEDEADANEGQEGDKEEDEEKDEEEE